MKRFEQYAIKRGDDIADPALWDAILQDLDDRLNAVESSATALDGAVANVEALGVERVNATLNPLVAQALAKITSVANLLEAGSASSVTIAASGQVTFIIAGADRTIWPLPSFVSASLVTDPTQYIAGRVISFDRASGALVVDIQDHGGAGTYASWVVRLSGMPGVKGDTGAQGPQGATGALSGNASNLGATAPSGFTGANVQDVLASVAATVIAQAATITAQGTAISGKAPTYHTHGEGDVSGLAADLSSKAAVVHSHAIGDVLNLQTALDAKAATSALSNYATTAAIANMVTTNAQATFTKQQGFGLVLLTDAATISWDVSSAQVAQVTLGGNRTLGNPSNAIAGFTYILEVVQDAVGGRTLAYGSAYQCPDDTPLVIASGAGKKSILTFLYDGAQMLGVGSLNY